MLYFFSYLVFCFIGKVRFFFLNVKLNVSCYIRLCLLDCCASMVPAQPHHCMQEPRLGPSFPITGKGTLLDNSSFSHLIWTLERMGPLSGSFLSSEESFLHSGADVGTGQWVWWCAPRRWGWWTALSFRPAWTRSETLSSRQQPTRQGRGKKSVWGLLPGAGWGCLLVCLSSPLSSAPSVALFVPSLCMLYS